MRQVWITKAGAPETLQVKEAADPVAGPNQVRVRVRAAGVNFADVLARIGIYPDAPPLPAVVGYEISGVIDQVGAQVQGYREGDRVIGLCRFGGYSDTVVLSPESLFPMPPSMDFLPAAAIPVNYLTAYQMLFVMGSLRRGDRILVHSAAGGVGLAVGEMARIAGAEVIGVASPSKHAFLKERGVHHTLSSHSTDLVAEVKRATGGRGVELALDPIGGKSWAQSYECLRPTGRIVMFGIAGAATGKTKNTFSFLKTAMSIPWLKFNPVTLINDNKGAIGVNMGHLWDEQEKVRQWGLEILRWVQEGKVQPHVDKAFRFDEAPSAHHYLQDRKNIGKVLLIP